MLTKIRSLSNKFDELRLLILNHSPDLCIITESWLDVDTPDSSILIENYAISRKDRPNGIGGGLICYTRDSCTVSVISCDTIIPATQFQTEFLTLFIKEFFIVVIIMYHPYWNHPSAHNEALISLTSIMDYSVIQFGSNVRICLVGDFNDLRKCYETIGNLTRLTPIVDFHTRGEQTLDQLFVNFAVNHRPSRLPPIGRSDHCVILWHPSDPCAPIVSKKRIRKFSKSNVARFAEAICSTDWLSVVSSRDQFDEALNHFVNHLSFLFDHCFPYRTVRIRSTDPEWMNESLKVLIDDRDRAFANKQWSRYNRLKEEVCAHVIYLKRSHVDNAVASKDSKKVWKSLRLISRYCKSSPVGNFSVNDLNSYFLSNFQTLGPNTFEGVVSHLPPIIDSDQVTKTLLALSNTSGGPDNIPAWVFRCYADFLAPAITMLLNWSLRCGSVPSCLKMANVRPIPKCVQPNSVSDFRPISLLPVLSKIFERIVLRVLLLPYVKRSVDKSQFAFIPRCGAGTTPALVLVQHQILQFLDSESGGVRMLSIDLSKAFDKVPHHVIIDSCKRFNIPSSTLKWISSFLSERSQRVVVNGVCSPWVSVPSGIPQGSVLGPLLFTMAIDSIKPVCRNTSLVKYADDLLFLHFVRKSVDDNLQNEWNNMKSWSISNHLPINVSKCCVLDIVTKSTLCTRPVVLDSGIALTQVDSLTFLGVCFSRDLKWNLHVDRIIKKACKRIFIIRNLRRSNCPKNLMLRCYIGFIRSVLLYSFACFCNIPDYLVDKLLCVERRIYRVMDIPHHSADSLLTVADRTCSKLYFDIVKHEDHPLREMFTKQVSDRVTRGSSVLRRPFAKTKRFSSSFIKFCK